MGSRTLIHPFLLSPCPSGCPCCRSLNRCLSPFYAARIHGGNRNRMCARRYRRKGDLSPRDPGHLKHSVHIYVVRHRPRDGVPGD